MPTKTAKEIRAEARKALGANNGQYWIFFGGGMLLAISTVLFMLPIMAILFAGVGFSGILPYFLPGGVPEIGLFLDPEVMLPLLSAVLAVSILIIYPIGFLKWGQASMSIATMRRGLKFGHAFAGWGHGWKMGWIEMVRGTYIILWLLLLFVPGIVKTFSYGMTEYIAVDHPDWNATQCITESRRLMDGNKWRYFCLLLSFIGWWFLVFLSSFVLNGLAQWFFLPYFETARAAFYEDLLDRDAATS